MISTLVFYTVFSSVVLIYGAGLNTATVISERMKDLTLPLVRIFSSVLSSATLTWVITKFILVPLKITLLYPLVAVLVFIAFSLFIDSLIRIVSGKAAKDFNFSFLVVLLALNESARLADVLLISLSAFLSISLVIPLFHSLERRIDVAGNSMIHSNRKSLLLVSAAIVIVALLSGNVSPFTPGVLK